MTEQTDLALADYLRRMMRELNYDSERAFALFLGVSYSTVNRILKGTRVGPEPLEQIASALHVPVENLYRLAGYLPPEETRAQVMREIEHLLRQLPEADQRRVLDLVRVEYLHHQRQQKGATEQPATDDQKMG